MIRNQNIKNQTTMKTNRYLLPHALKKVGWVMLAILAIYLILTSGNRLTWTWDAASGAWIPSRDIAPWLNNFLVSTTFAIILAAWSIVALVMTAFSREKVEDEYIMKLRGDSLIWATIGSLVISLAISIWEFAGGMGPSGIPYAIYFVLILFIIRFNIVLFRLRHEK